MSGHRVDMDVSMTLESNPSGRASQSACAVWGMAMAIRIHHPNGRRSGAMQCNALQCACRCDSCTRTVAATHSTANQRSYTCSSTLLLRSHASLNDLCTPAARTNEK